MALSQDGYTPNISVPLFLEYESVLKRPGLITSMGEHEIDAVLNYIASKARQKRIFFLWRPFLKDPKDDLVLEVAVASGCSHIVTFNLKDFQGIEKFGVKAVTPQTFMIERGIHT